MQSESRRYSKYYTYVKPVFKIPIIKTYGTTILTLIAMSIFIIFAIKPTVETILGLQKKIINSKQALATLTKKSEDLSAARDNYRRLSTQIKSNLQARVPSQPSLKNLILELEGIALANQASISALQIQPLKITPVTEKEGTELTEISFTFNLEGSYQNLLGTLNKIQNSTRIITIDNLIVNKPEGGTAALFISVVGRTYYLK